MALREQLEYAATAAVLTVSRMLPEAAVYALFKGFGLSFFHVGGRRRRMALANTEIAFPEMPLPERRALVRTSYINLSECMALNLLITTGRVSNEHILELVETDDWHRFEEVFAKTGDEGFLAITGHLGNWELMSQYTALRLERQIHVIARQGNNRLLEDRVVRPLRERFGVSVFYKKNALMRMVKAIKRGDLCGLLIDQKLNPPEGIYVELFGKPAPTTGSSALLQIRFGVTVVPAFMVKSGHRKYRMLIGEPVEWQDDGRPLEDQVLELTRVHQGIVEDRIRQYPDQWFWAHNRWGLPRVKK